MKTITLSIHEKSNANGRWTFTLGFAALVVGVSIYLILRPPGSIYGTQSLPPIFRAIPRMFWAFSGPLPTFAHVIAFSLMSAALLKRRKEKLTACLAWALIEIAFELIQHPGARALARKSHSHVMLLLSSGHFDPHDLIAAVAGALLCSFFVAINEKEIRMRLSKNVWRSVAIAFITLTGLLGIIATSRLRPPSPCEKESGTKYVSLARQNEAREDSSSNLYYYHLLDPLASCEVKNARVSRVENSTDYDLDLKHGGQSIFLGHGSSTDGFDGLPVEGEWTANIRRRLTIMPKSVKIQVDWTRPNAATAGTD